MAEAEVSEFHFPCWSLTLHPDEGAREQRFIVWGPGPVSHQGREPHGTRDHWAANWESNFGRVGSHVSGDALEKVLTIFPPEVAEKFRAVITEWESTR